MKELSAKKLLLLVILLGSAGLCCLLGVKVQQAICDNVYVLSFIQEDKKFLSSDISFAEKEGISLTYVKYLYPEISNGFRTETATVIATNDNYSYFTGMEITAGAFFNGIQVDKKMSVAVLNEAAAYQLFGNYKCIGENIYLDQNAFEVIGIVKERGNLNEPKIYVPDRTVETLGITCTEVNQLWCRFSNMAEVSMTMSKMGYFINEIDITQMDLYKGVFIQRFAVLLFFACLFPFIRILKVIFSKAKELRQGTDRDREWTIKWILQIVTCVGGLVLILKAAQLAWFVPPNYKLVGKERTTIFYEILEFYTLSGIEIDGMHFLSRWNLLSLFCIVVCMISGVIIKSYLVRTKDKE